MDWIDIEEQCTRSNLGKESIVEELKEVQEKFVLRGKVRKNNFIGYCVKDLRYD